MFMYRDFYDLLIRRLKPGDSVVEMGTFYGQGLIYLAQNTSDVTIYGVDSFKVSDAPFHPEGYGDEDFYQHVLKNIRDSGTGGTVHLVRGSSPEVADRFEDRSMDCVFIDAAHDEDSVATDIEAWRGKVKPGGILAGDDYIAPWGVIPAVDKKFPDRKLVGQAWWTEVQ